MTVSCYQKFEIKAENAVVTTPSGKQLTLNGFPYQPIRFSYDDEGSESVLLDGESYSVIRFFPDEIGHYTVTADGNTVEFDCIADRNAHGYVEISRRDARYFEYTDGTPFYPVGINMAFISPVGASNGKEFGLENKWRWLGMKQYERWFRSAAKYGVNFVRVWIGHEYFNPDTEEAGVLNLAQLSKIDALTDLAARYGIVLKLTLEQFRFFDYVRVADSNSYSDDIFRKFNKKLWKNGRRCESAAEWLAEDIWRDAWSDKLKQIAARLSGNPTVFGIELWNEMNCMPSQCLNEWNRRMLAEAKALFPRQLVMNSLGSYGSEGARNIYRSFCWDASDIKQMHCYVDGGCRFVIAHGNPIEMLQDGILELTDTAKPFFVAETGAVNNSHSGPFRYYCNDHRGILFCDLVYTPLFCGAAGCGHIWHWDERYVESKNLYRYFAPIAKLGEGIDFAAEDFKPDSYQDGEVALLLLRGKTVTLGYIRNLSDSWENTLRDLNEPTPVTKTIPVSLSGNLSVIPVWDEESGKFSLTADGLSVDDLCYGTLFKIV